MQSPKNVKKISRSKLLTVGNFVLLEITEYFLASNKVCANELAYPLFVSVH